MSNRRAVIDVGTNSVKLLVADVEGTAVNPCWEEGRQTRLGEGFYETHELQPAAIQRTGDAVAEFAKRARTLGAGALRVIATSAARDAVNAGLLVDMVQRRSGLPLEIITGEQEAELACLGVNTDPKFAGKKLLIIDAGGGSTEFILGQGSQRGFQRSFPIGAVRLLERFKPGDPPKAAELQQCREWLAEFMDREVRALLDVAMVDGLSRPLLVGTGGTAAILARMEGGFNDYDRDRIETTTVSAEALKRWVNSLWSLPLEARRGITGLPPERADVILTGAAIYEAVMWSLGFQELSVSTRGLRFAAVLELGKIS